MGRLEGKVAIITGAARGQGEAEARLFVAEGARVLACDVLDEEGAAVAAELGDAAAYAHLDVTEPAQWEEAVALATERFGGVDCLVNNAGILRPGTILDTPLEHLRAIMEVNQIGVWLGIRAVVPALRARGGGSIVNISSGAGFVGTPGLAAYGMTKWAVRGLTKTAAIELADDRIRVNSVHPGVIDTPMLDDIGMADVREQLGSTVRYGRIGVPEDVARLVLYLASDESDFSTGSEFVVDGGALAGGGRPQPAGQAAAVAR